VTVWADDIRVKAWHLFAILVFGAGLGGVGVATAMLWIDGVLGGEATSCSSNVP
jgi:hypothetical protein